MSDHVGDALRGAFLEAFQESAVPLIRAVVREEVGRLIRHDPDRLVDAHEAARILAISPAALRKAAQRGSVPVQRVGRRLRFRLGDLLMR
jgi:hypothetical protein